MEASRSLRPDAASRPRRAALAAVTLLLASCEALRTPFALRQLNGSSPAAMSVPSASVSDRVAWQVRSRLADAYRSPAVAARWMRAVGDEPGRLVGLVRCHVAASGGDLRDCYESFVRDASGLGPSSTPPWGLPAPPDPGQPVGDFAAASSAAEVDAERFVANVLDAGAAVATFELLRGRGAIPPADLEDGIRKGTRLAASYVEARPWHRDPVRHARALVVSGGAANGAFGAGFVWRLLGVLQACRSAQTGGCPDFRIDLAAGSSTGALITLAVDDFFTPGQEASARDLLLHRYTCSVASDLYCVNDTWDWNLVRNVRGLVRFDGVRRILEAEVPASVAENGVESVAVSVDFETGGIFAMSDSDPADRGPPGSRTEAVLASIVEPVLAEPVASLPSSGGLRRGTFLDGGVRSGLPVMEAVSRGAERVLVLANSGLEPAAAPAPKHAFGVLSRTLDLLVSQPKIGEVTESDLAAVVRRLGEHNVCRARLEGRQGPVEEFCARGPVPRAEPAARAVVPPWMGLPFFPQVASSWRSLWVFRPEEPLQTAEGYAFRPDVMRELFLKGVETFQQRCLEVLALYEVESPEAHRACAERLGDVTSATALAFRPLAGCMAKVDELRTCD